MRHHQQKLHQYSQQIRKARRQELISARRVWNQLPSVLVELPSRIEHTQWTHSQELLDSISEDDLRIVDEALSNYLMNKYAQQLQKRIEKQDWQVENRFNLLRTIMRLRIAESTHIQQALNMLSSVNQSYSMNCCKQTAVVILRLMKQIAIYSQMSDTGAKMEKHQVCKLNSLMRKIKIYGGWPQESLSWFQQVVSEYRIYYLYLITNEVIDLCQYIQQHTILQIFCLIQDSINHKQQAEVIKAVDLLLKLLTLDPKQNKSLETALRSLEFLLIDGLQRAKLFVVRSQKISFTHTSLLFQGTFFSSLLTIMNNCDVSTLIHSIELLAQLFQNSDNYIDAIRRVTLPSKEIEIEEDKRRSNLVTVKRQQFKTYAEFFIFSMQSVLWQVRYKIYWLLSNILGSEAFFFSYGLQFIEKIYLQAKLQQQSLNRDILNQMTICILNFACNLKAEPDTLKHLLALDLSNNKNKSTPLKERENQEIHIPNYPDNCFFFCVETAYNVVEQLYNLSELQQEMTTGLKQNFTVFFHRALYSLYNIIEISKAFEDSRVYERVIGESQRRNLALKLEAMSDRLVRGENGWKQVTSLMEEVLTMFQSQKHTL